MQLPIKVSIARAPLVPLLPACCTPNLPCPRCGLAYPCPPAHSLPACLQVVQVKTESKEGYTALQLGSGAKRPKQLHGTQRGHFEAAGVPPKRRLAEFRVSPDALLPVGHELRASHFVAGQFVDVTGTSIGKGFQGVMKRWGFAGQPASHGNSLAHRAAGSTGACQVRCARGVRCGDALALPKA